MNNLFYFEKISNIEVQNFDNSLEHFHSTGIEGTIRENLQNSIDAKLPGLEAPVVVNIKLEFIKKNELPGIYELQRHIDSLEGGNLYTKETIKHMKEELNKENIPVLIFEDNNTKGLSGANQIGKDTTYNIFSYKKGVHYEDDDLERETVRGGSHGVGKISNNAASNIHLMYFSNCDANGEKHVGGTVHLIEHSMSGENYRSTGYFSGINEMNQYIPYENKGFPEIFEKNTRGLKVIIPFVKGIDINDDKIIVKAVCDNFFHAILEKKLNVYVSTAQGVTEISEQTIKRISLDKKIYLQNIDDLSQMNKNFTPLYIKNYLEGEFHEVTIPSNTDVFRFKLYFLYNEEIRNGRVGIIRSMGMKIVDYKVKGRVRSPFNALLIGGPKEDNYLKMLENESHTQLSSDSIRDKNRKRDANKFLKNLNSEITNIIDSEWEKRHPSDMKIDTSDLLYETKVTFKSRLEELSEKVELSNGKELRKRKIRERRKKRTQQGQINKKDKVSSRVRKPRKLKSSPGEEQFNETIIVPTEIVNRMVLTNREIIQFNLSEIREVIPFGTVNIGFRVIDGDGKEYDYEFDMKSAYKTIGDATTMKSYDFDSFTIYNVQVINGVIKIYLDKKNTLSDSLKFVYKLEVL